MPNIPDAAGLAALSDSQVDALLSRSTQDECIGLIAEHGQENYIVHQVHEGQQDLDDTWAQAVRDMARGVIKDLRCS